MKYSNIIIAEKNTFLYNFTCVLPNPREKKPVSVALRYVDSSLNSFCLALLLFIGVQYQEMQLDVYLFQTKYTRSLRKINKQIPL